MLAGSTSSVGAVLRLNALGVPDTGYGNNGDGFVFASNVSFLALDVQADGKAMVGGVGAAGGGTLNEVDGGAGAAIVHRYLADGSADTDFSADGRVELAGVLDKADDVRVLTDGHILVAGFRLQDATLVRLNADGTIDTSFGADGALNVNLGLGQMFLNSIAIDSDNRIVGTGSVGEQLFVLRSTPDGQLDTSFGSGGGRVFDDPASPLQGNAIALQADGAIVIAGSSLGTFGAIDQYLVMRLQGGPQLADLIFAHAFDSSNALEQRRN